MDTSENDTFISILKDEYQKRLNFYGISGKDLTGYAWSESKRAQLNIINVYNDTFSHNCLLLYAVPEAEKDIVNYHDLSDQTKNPDFIPLSTDPPKMLSWLVSKKLVPEEHVENNSVTMCFLEYIPNYFQSIANSWAKSWVDNEYRQTNKILSSRNDLQPFPITHKKFFIDRYHFDDMLESINDKQFSSEFNECLWAYEHKKWFICAAGLGSCLEHLMEIIIINYDRKGYNLLRKLGKDPTIKNYLYIFRNSPINIEARQETYIKMLFMARNSIDHHNTGYTSKNICDSLLDGVRNMFNDYYAPSIMAKDVPKHQK